MSFYWIWSRHPEVKNTHLFECLLEKQNFKNLECQIRIRTIILINVISEWDSEKMPLLRKTSYKKEKKKSLELYQSQRLLCTSNDWNPWGQPKAFQGAKGTQLFFTALQLRNPTRTNKLQQQSKCISLSGSNWFAVYFFIKKKKKKKKTLFCSLGRRSNIFSNFFWQRKRQAYESNLMCDGLQLEATRSVNVSPFPTMGWPLLLGTCRSLGMLEWHLKPVTPAMPQL